MNPRRLFVASCIALVASAFSFVIRQDILPAWGRSFDLNQTSRGAIGGTAFLGMADRRWSSAHSLSMRWG